jgi:N-acetylglucosaminyldiphosphoundecaprenol N-acetyl-beta-D-mannosaminyltransferase
MFFLGAADGVAAETARVLQACYPDLRIAGAYAPPPLPMSAQDTTHVLSMVRAARPDILLVAFGAPLQEEWIRTHMRRLAVPVCIGVGGAFDMIAGRVRRAPLWMQRCGLEWLCRLVQEPRRLWRRYVVHDLPAFFRLMMQSSQGDCDVPTSVDDRTDSLLGHEPSLVSTLDPFAAEETDAHIA